MRNKEKGSKEKEKTKSNVELTEGVQEGRESPPKLMDAQLRDTATHGGMVHARRHPLGLQLKVSQSAWHYLPPGNVPCLHHPPCQPSGLLCPFLMVRAGPAS